MVCDVWCVCVVCVMCVCDVCGMCVVCVQCVCVCVGGEVEEGGEKFNV